MVGLARTSGLLGGTADKVRIEYGYDRASNRLAKVSHFENYAAYSAGPPTPDKVVEHTYDYLNRWVKRVVDPDGDTGSASIQQTIFAYDGNQIALHFSKTGTGDLTASNLSHRYTWGPNVDQLLADEQVVNGLNTAGTVLWPLCDHLDTVRDVASYNSGNDTTAIANHLVYDSFGNVTSGTNPILFGFTGRPFDADTGLQNNLHRWYDPAVGRWLSEDPIGYDAEDFNLYRYCGNMPTNATDPTGEDWLDCMADCVDHNDPVNLAIRHGVKALLLAGGIQDKTMVAWVFKQLGQDKLAQKILQMTKNPTQKEITNMLSVLATQLPKNAKAAKIIMRKVGGAVAGLEILYGGALVYVESYCCAYCTTRWWYGGAQYDPADNILDSVKRYYFPD